MEPFIGEIVIFGGNFAPRGWAFCDGQLLAISQNTALFSILGTTYGGDGRTTFALPDLRSRAPIGPRNGPGLSDYKLGQRGGVETVTLNITQIPSHTHVASGTTKASFTPPFGGGTQTNPNGANFSGSGSKLYSTSANNVTMAANNVDVRIGNTGGSLSHENRQPFLAINYIIALVGVFPSRN